MRIASGTTDQYIYFVGLDSTDLKTRETGLASFTVYRSRNGGAAAAYTTPTVNETDSSNMPGVYELLLDEDMTIDSGDDEQEVCLHITHAGMAPVTRVFTLFRPKITAGNTLGVESDGDLTKVNTLDGHTPQTGDAYARLGAPAGASVSADVAAVKAETANILDDTDLIDDATSGLAKIATDVAAVLVDTAEIGAAGAGLTEAGGTGDHLTALASQSSVNTIDNNVDAILEDTGTTIPVTLATIEGYIDTEVAALTAELAKVPKSDGTTTWNSTALGSINAECDTALSDYDGPTKTEMDSAFTEIKGATWDTTDTLEAIRDRGDAAWVTATGFSTLDAAGVRTAVGLASANLDTQLGKADLTAALTEAYRSTGATGSAAQLLYEILAHLGNFANASTTKTTKKLDGSTTAKTYTYDDATNPTSITEAT